MSTSKPKKVVRRGASRARAVWLAARRRAEAAAAQPASAARRDFLRGASAAGAILGLPTMAQSVGAQDASGEDVAQKLADPRASDTQAVTLFFNLTHLGGAGMTTNHYVYIAGRKYPIGRVADAPEALVAMRRGNAFLREVEDRHITHCAVNVGIPKNGVALAYLSCNENVDTGTWEMTGMYFQAPPRSLVRAYREARKLTPKGPLPLSGKRRMYGVRAASSLQDFMDEAALVDSTCFAEAIVGLHPDILSMEPSSFGHIKKNYVSQDAYTQRLGILQLPSMGPAVPTGATNVSGKTPWATLTPWIDPATGHPYKKSDGKLNLYYPEWHPTIGEYARPAVGAIHPMVRDDPGLGLDVTTYNLNNGTVRPPKASINGKLWGRHDGVATIERAASMADATGPTLTFRNQSVETGLVVKNPSISTAADGRIKITLDNISNWFLRWLGVWVQFYDANGKVIPLDALPADTCPGAPGPYPRKDVDQDTWIFLGALPPAFTLLGVPVQPGTFAPVVNLPNGPAHAASSIRIMYSGLGLSGGMPVDVPQVTCVPGILMTGAFNYAVVGFFMAVGASGADATVKLAVSLGGGAVAQAIQTIVGSVVDQKSFIAGLTSFTMGFLKILHDTGQKRVLGYLADGILGELALNDVIDSVPVAGQIAQAVAVVTGAIQLAETYVEIAISPPAYFFECVATHDLAVTFLPDQNSQYFPDPGPGNTLYYKVSYLFDDGTAHTQSSVLVPDHRVTSITITFRDIPYGGQVSVSIGFYVRTTNTPAGLSEWCAGHATTGLTDNTVDVIQPPPGLTGFRITRNKIPIQSTTSYVHTRKTVLDASDQHRWLADPDGRYAPHYFPPPGGQVPGLTAFESITVRQATAAQAGYVGYSWEAFSSGVYGCGTTGPGQFDQMANLNTDDGNGGANAQNGYVASACGYDTGVRMGYNLLSHKSRNIYVDTATLLVRPVNLDPPGIAGPASNSAFALLSNDSTRCLLHPSGHIVSIDNANHRIESLKLPPAALPDAVVTQYHRTRAYSGMGTQPGLMIHPVGLAISPDGVVLVLEDAPWNNRIQAFDLGGNPVPYFKNQDPPYYLELPATSGSTYLDLAVEFSGYLYVLSRIGKAHRLDIYHPLQKGRSPVCTTLSVNAARIAVDFWRSVYTLNYEVLRLPNGNIPGFTEPSVSVWKPTTP